jgi:hypothetical protein
MVQHIITLKVHDVEIADINEIENRSADPLSRNPEETDDGENQFAHEAGEIIHCLAETKRRCDSLEGVKTTGLAPR